MSTIVTIPSDARHYVSTGHGRRFRIQIGSALGWLSRSLERRKSRLDLLELTDTQLGDIGITPEQARREGIRPFWE